MKMIYLLVEFFTFFGKNIATADIISLLNMGVCDS